MLNMKKYNAEQLEEMVFEVNNWNGSLEDYNFYDMEELDELFAGVEPSELLRIVNAGRFSIHDDYFKGDVYGRIESFNKEEVNEKLEDNHDEIVEHYNELVEAGEIEDVI